MYNNKDLETRCFECDFGKAREDYASSIQIERQHFVADIQKFDEPVINELLALYDLCCVPDCVLDCPDPLLCPRHKSFIPALDFVVSPVYEQLSFDFEF